MIEVIPTPFLITMVKIDRRIKKVAAVFESLNHSHARTIGMIDTGDDSGLKFRLQLHAGTQDRANDKGY